MRLHPHARDRMRERGATEEEVESTIGAGERFAARFRRQGFRRDFRFDAEWQGHRYETKQVEVIAVFEQGDWLAISVIVKYFLTKGFGGIQVQLSYDPQRNIAYLRLREAAGIQVQTVPVSDEINIDLAPDGSVYGIELLNANEQLYQADGGRLVIEFAGERLEVPLPQPA